MKSKLMILILLIIDVAMVAMERRVFFPWSGPMQLRFYTNSSNIFAMFACAICAITGVVCLVCGIDIPRWAQLLRYVAACCLMVTFIIAACVLVPLDPSINFKGFMLTGGNLFVHTLCPLLLLASFLISGGEPLTAKHALIAIIPTVLYGIITITMIVRNVYSAPYFFFRVTTQPWYETVKWMTIIVSGNFAVAWLLTRLHRLLH